MPETLLKPVEPPSKAPYIWAVVILVLIGAGLVMGVLLLRPLADPLEVIARVMTGLTPTIAAVLAYMKSQQTHLAVNSRLDAFMSEHAKVARSEGVLQGTADEQARVGTATSPSPAAPVQLIAANGPGLVLPAQVTLSETKKKVK